MGFKAIRQKYELCEGEKGGKPESQVGNLKALVLLEEQGVNCVTFYSRVK